MRPDVPERRQLLRRVLAGRVRFTPHHAGEDQRYTFAGHATLGPLVGEVAVTAGSDDMVAPTGIGHETSWFGASFEGLVLAG